MADLSKLTADVAAQKTIIDSAVTLINGLAAQIKTLPTDQAAIDALAAQVEAESSNLSAAVAANTSQPTP